MVQYVTHPPLVAGSLAVSSGDLLKSSVSVWELSLYLELVLKSSKS